MRSAKTILFHPISFPMRRFFLSCILILSAVVAFGQTKGFEKSVEATGGIGLDKYQNFTFGVNFVGGYRLSDYFFIGAGAGYEYLDGLYYTSYEYHSGAGNSYHGTSEDVRNNIKVFGRLKANLTATKVSPFFAVDLGANIGLSSNEIKMANGFYFEPGFGCDFAISPKQSIYLMLAYNGIGYDYEAFDTTLGSAGHEMRHALAGKFAIHLGFRF